MIYHITNKTLWDNAMNSGIYDAPSLKAEGFIHFSTLAQLFESAALHLKGETDLMVIGTHERWVKDDLKWEAGRNEELFPHVYATIAIDKIETIQILSLTADGKYELE